MYLACESQIFTAESYAKVQTPVKILDLSMQSNYFYLFSTLIHGIKQSILKTISRVVLWSWNFYKELLYLLLHHCPKIRTGTCIQQEIQLKLPILCILIEQKLLGNRKSACNKSCRSSHKERRTVEFAFFPFFYDLLSILQVFYFLKTKEKGKKTL